MGDDQDMACLHASLEALHHAERWTKRFDDWRSPASWFDVWRILYENECSFSDANVAYLLESDGISASRVTVMRRRKAAVIKLDDARDDVIRRIREADRAVGAEDAEARGDAVIKRARRMLDRSMHAPPTSRPPAAIAPPSDEDAA